MCNMSPPAGDRISNRARTSTPGLEAGPTGVRTFILSLTLLFIAACSRESAAPARAPDASAQTPRHVVIVTIDTLRADHVGAYGYAGARTPTLDRLAREGVRFDRAFASAPITLTSHASLMTGRYPPGHGARHNGMRMDLTTPTLAETFATQGYTTGAFVAAFPLDRRFGLIKGFQSYGDTMPRDESGHLTNERPGRVVVDEAVAWLGGHQRDRVFLWVHLFEPHAPYGNPVDPAQASRSPVARYDDDIAEADVQVGRLLDALGERRSGALIVVAGDHGEAFGEHEEVSHSLFTYDTTLRVPLVFSGASIARPAVVSARGEGELARLAAVQSSQLIHMVILNSRNEYNAVRAPQIAETGNPLDPHARIP